MDVEISSPNMAHIERHERKRTYPRLLLLLPSPLISLAYFPFEEKHGVDGLFHERDGIFSAVSGADGGRHGAVIATVTYGTGLGG